MVWYATLNINDSNALLSRFEQKYPFVKTELLRAGSEQLLNRILTEDGAGRSALDLVNLTTINALKNAVSYKSIARRNFRLIRSHSRMRRAIGQLSTTFTMLLVTIRRWWRPKMRQRIGMIFSIPSGKGKSAWIKRNMSGMRRRSSIGAKKKR